MKILYLTKYSRNAGSSRLRSFQYFPYLEKAGLKVEVSPLFSEDYLKQLYTGQSTKKEALKGYLRRFFKLFSVWEYDRVVIEKELFPYLPAFAEVILHFAGVKYVVDYDDAVFHNYDRSPNALIRKILGRKIDTVMKHSWRVIAGNAYLAGRAKDAGAGYIDIVPTVIDLQRYPVKVRSDSDIFTVGWIGTKTTFEKHLVPCRDWIRALQEVYPQLYFHIVGITEDMDLGPNVRYFPWSEETEVEEILKMDVGIMPLQDSEWEKGKCAYKLIQYAACGIPGVASDVGMNRVVTVPGQTGILASTPEEWMEAIVSLMHNPEERFRLGSNARQKVDAKFCVQRTWIKWEQILKNMR